MPKDCIMLSQVALVAVAVNPKMVRTPKLSFSTLQIIR